MSDLVPPVPKMPTGRLVMMVSVTFLFEILQTICSMLVVFAPALVCVFAKYWVQETIVNNETIGDVVCIVAGSGIAATYFVGVGVGIFLLGWLLALGVSLFSYLILFFWFKYAGISFMDKAGSKLFIYTGSLILEVIPFVSVLPWNTAAVFMVARQVQKEDREAKKQYETSVARAKADDARHEQRAIEETARATQLPAQKAANDNAGVEERRAA